MFPSLLAIVVLVLLWHFNILNTQISGKWDHVSMTQKTSHLSRDDSQSFHCLYDSLFFFSFFSGGNERAECLLLLPANFCFCIHAVNRHRAIHDPNCPRGFVGLQRPSSHKAPQPETWSGWVFWTDVEGTCVCFCFFAFRGQLGPLISGLKEEKQFFF